MKRFLFVTLLLAAFGCSTSQTPGGSPNCTGPDSDGDGVPDMCDVCGIGSDNLDADQDTVPDACDVCVGFSDLIDTDGDGVPEGCDVCQGYDDSLDGDGDGVPDGCDVMPDMGFVEDHGPPDLGPPDLGPPDLGPPDMGPPDLGPPDLGTPDIGMCGDALMATPVSYYVDSITIPTEADALMGRIVGFDLDGVSQACGLDDWAGQVDNALLDLAGALPSISPDVDLQAALDEGICGDAMNPPRVALEIEVRTGVGCAVVTFRDGLDGGAPLAPPFTALFDGTHITGGRPASFTVNFPFVNDGGGIVNVPLALTNVHFRATIGASGLTNIILGGQAPAASLEQTIMDLLPLINDPNCMMLGNCIQFSSIAGILSGLYDVPSPTGACGSSGALSAGLFMTADTSATPPACSLP